MAELSLNPGLSYCDYPWKQWSTGTVGCRTMAPSALRRSRPAADRRDRRDRRREPDQPVGVVGVAFSRRTSDSLTAVGHPLDITPSPGAKVIFDHAGRIQAFNMGPVGQTAGA
jgi:hypothetical protein